MMHNPDIKQKKNVYDLPSKYSNLKLTLCRIIPTVRFQMDFTDQNQKVSLEYSLTDQTLVLHSRTSCAV